LTLLVLLVGDGTYYGRILSSNFVLDTHHHEVIPVKVHRVRIEELDDVSWFDADKKWSYKLDLKRRDEQPLAHPVPENIKPVSRDWLVEKDERRNGNRHVAV
jgi:hypothetical protein